MFNAENLPRIRRSVVVIVVAACFGASLVIGAFTGNYPGAELAAAVGAIIVGDSYLRTREKEQGVANQPGRD